MSLRLPLVGVASATQEARKLGASVKLAVVASLEAIFLSTGERPVEERLVEWRRAVAGRRDLWPLLREVRYQPGRHWLVVPCDSWPEIERDIRERGIESLIGVSYDDQARLGKAASRLSRFFETTALGVVMQSVVDSFAFYRFDNGREIRCLRYGIDGPEERVWNTVRGEPEDWEARIVFRADDLESYLQFHDEDEAEALRAQFLARRYEVGSPDPGIDARHAVGEILQEYGIGLEWHTKTSLRPSLARRLLLRLGA